jgi:mRNA interferase RelE/StbE
LAYKVTLSDDAAKVFRKLDRPIQKRIAALIAKIECSDNPRFVGKALVGREKEWRYRVGDYRLVCEILDQELIIWIVKIGLRSSVYK